MISSLGVLGEGIMGGGGSVTVMRVQVSSLHEKVPRGYVTVSFLDCMHTEKILAQIAHIRGELCPEEHRYKAIALVGIACVVVKVKKSIMLHHRKCVL